MKPFVCLVVFAGLFGQMSGGATSVAQVATSPIKVILYPADAPHPRLKYRLLPEFSDRIAGNAAVYYGKVKAEQNRFFNDGAMRQNIDRWQLAPLADLRGDQVNVPLTDYFFEQAALCDHCDWQLPIGREPFFGILLSEAQETRGFGRILAAKARIDVARGDYESAVRHLRLSYALACNVAEGETLVNGLIGIAICGITSKQTLEFVQQPDAPNLYWALSTLPRPFIDFRDAVEVEINGWALSYPELKEPEELGRTAESWHATLIEIWKAVADSIDDDAYKKPPEALVEQSLANAPAAFGRLVKQGWMKDQLMSMPAEQVVVLDMMTQFREFGQEAGTAFFLPYPEAIRELDAVKARVDAFRQEAEECAALPLMTVPPLMSCRTAQVRMEREFAVLQLLEALRMHAARHGGLPERLGDVADVPVPRDPVTGLPFRYLREGEVARIGGPPLKDVPLDYEIALGKKSK